MTLQRTIKRGRIDRRGIDSKLVFIRQTRVYVSVTGAIPESQFSTTHKNTHKNRQDKSEVIIITNKLLFKMYINSAYWAISRIENTCCSGWEMVSLQPKDREHAFSPLLKVWNSTNSRVWYLCERK